MVTLEAGDSLNDLVRSFDGEGNFYSNLALV